MKLLVFFFCLMNTIAYSQRGFEVDSIQIKVYTQIEYENYKPIKIEVTKIFCDYCSEEQLKKVELKAIQTTQRVRYNSESILANGSRRIKHVIRFKRDKF